MDQITPSRGETFPIGKLSRLTGVQDHPPVVALIYFPRSFKMQQEPFSISVVQCLKIGSKN